MNLLDFTVFDSTGGTILTRKTLTSESYGFGRTAIQNNKQIIILITGFNKTYDSNDRYTLLHILKEMGMDDKTHYIIKQTFTNTYSQVLWEKFQDTFKLRLGFAERLSLTPYFSIASSRPSVSGERGYPTMTLDWAQALKQWKLIFLHSQMASS